jgi:hypothetical protein
MLPEVGYTPGGRRSGRWRPSDALEPEQRIDGLYHCILPDDGEHGFVERGAEVARLLVIPTEVGEAGEDGVDGVGLGGRERSGVLLQGLVDGVGVAVEAQPLALGVGFDVFLGQLLELRERLLRGEVRSS